MPIAAYGIMLFYKTMLEVAEKQINLYKSFRDLRKMSLPEEQVKQLEAGSEAVVKNAVKEAVDEAMRQIPSDLDDGRTNEIRVLLNKRGSVIGTYIAGGARIYVSVESLGQIDELNASLSSGEREVDIHEAIGQQKSIEKRIETAHIDYNEPVKKLLESRLSKDTQEK